MTETEADAALARIGAIVREGAEPAPRAFGFMDDGWDRARARLEEELREAAEALRAFVRCEDGAVGVVVTDWTGDVYCVWGAESGEAERARHLERFQGDFAVRVRVGYLLAAAGGAALELARLAAAPLTVISAARAAGELVEEVRLLRAAMG